MNRKITKRRGRDEWDQIIARQQSSGKTISEYCRDENLSEKGFYGWRRRLRLKPGAPCEGFMRINPVVEKNSDPVVRIHTPGGCCLEIPLQQADGAYVKSILEALGA